MFGIDNITNNNGWAMAVVGATTVFLGLVVLSFVISQIHKILELWENRGKKLNGNKKQAQLEICRNLFPRQIRENISPPPASLPAYTGHWLSN